MSERRYFFTREVDALVPWLANLFGAVAVAREEMRCIYKELSEHGIDLAELDEDTIDTANDELVSELRRFALLRDQVIDSVRQIEERGGIVKDLEDGLVDFPHMLDGAEVYLCWRYGEESITHYHEVESGYSGRKALPGREDVSRRCLN